MLINKAHYKIYDYAEDKKYIVHHLLFIFTTLLDYFEIQI